MLGDKFLDYIIYNIEITNNNFIVKKDLNDLRIFTENQYIHNFFKSIKLSEFIINGNSASLDYFKTNSTKGMATIFEAFIYVLIKNLNENAVKKFLLESNFIKSNVM